MKKTKKSNQKPIEYDIHLKYRCRKCGQDHWLSFKEAATKHFKIVCYCGHVFTVKRVAKFKLQYAQDKPKSKVVVQEHSEPVQPKEKSKMPLDKLKSGVKVLVGYGFTPPEASELLEKTFEIFPELALPELIKKSLESLKGQL